MSGRASPEQLWRFRMFFMIQSWDCFHHQSVKWSVKNCKKCCHNYSEPDMSSETPHVCSLRHKNETGCDVAAWFWFVSQECFRSGRYMFSKISALLYTCLCLGVKNGGLQTPCFEGLSYMSADVKMKRRLVLGSFCLSLLRSLPPSNKSGSHICVTLPSAPSRSVRPFCLPPLAFIRTVDGESRTEAMCTNSGHWCTHKALPYVKASTCATFTHCFSACLMCFIVWKRGKKRMTPITLAMFWKFSTAKVKGKVGVKGQGQPSWVGLLNQIF